MQLIRMGDITKFDDAEVIDVEDMNEIFDKYGNYKYPTDVVLDEPNYAIGFIATTEEQDDSAENETSMI